MNIIIKLATTTLQNLRLAIAGTIALSGTLIDAVDALFMARIPEAWLKKSWEVSNGSHVVDAAESAATSTGCHSP